MKKALTLITLLLVAVTGMAQREGESAPSIKKNKVMEALISDACRRGMSADGTYCIDNSKNKLINLNDAVKYMQAKGYIVTSSSTKGYMRFGEPVETLDKIVFSDPNNFYLFAFNHLKGNRNIQYSQLKNRGTFFCELFVKKGLFKTTNVSIGKEIHHYPLSDNGVWMTENVLWSGSVVNGFLNGHGIGFHQQGDTYYFLEGDFKCGFPVGGINCKLITKDNWEIYEDNQTVSKSKIASWSKITNPNELRMAIIEFTKTTYNEDAMQIEADYNQLLTLNKNINHNYQCKSPDVFIRLYSPLNIDTRGALLKAREIHDVQIVQAAMAMNERKAYYYISILNGPSFSMKEATNDTAQINSARRFVYQKIDSYTISPFRDYYVAVIDKLEDKADRIYDNINRQIHEYNGERFEYKQYRADKCEKCKIDGSKSTVPEGYVESSWFFGHPAQSEKDGKIVFVNGETVTWRYIYSGYDKGKIEADPSWSTSKTYNDEEEMMKDLIKRCKEHWCY